MVMSDHGFGNGASQVLLGGGQDASQVTTTAAKAGGFEARFFHKVSNSVMPFHAASSVAVDKTQFAPMVGWALYSESVMLCNLL